MTLIATGCKSSTPETPAPAAQPAATTPEKIGGSDVVKLQRKATGDGAKPEFLTATVLPGRGMNLFQITANIPGKGEIPLFFDLPDQFNQRRRRQRRQPQLRRRRSLPGSLPQPHPRQALRRRQNPHHRVARQDNHGPRKLRRQETRRRGALHPRPHPQEPGRIGQYRNHSRRADRDRHHPRRRLRRPLALEDRYQLHHRAHRRRS